MAYELKTKVSELKPEEFIATLDVKRRTEAELLLEMLTILTGVPAKMWGPSMIGFGTYDYTYASGHKGTWFRIGFSPRKPALVFYSIPGFDDLGAELAAIGPHKHEKSCLYLKTIDKDRMPALKALAAGSLKIMDERYPRN